MRISNLPKCTEDLKKKIDVIWIENSIKDNPADEKIRLQVVWGALTEHWIKVYFEVEFEKRCKTCVKLLLDNQDVVIDLMVTNNNSPFRSN